MRCRVVLGLMLLAASPAAGQSRDTVPPLPSITLPQELDRVLRDYERGWSGDDEAALVALFTPDGFVPAGTGWVRGSEAIRERYARTGGDLRLRALAYAIQDTVGYIVGAYRYGDEPGATDRGKFVLALRRGPDGRWLIAADLDQSNR